MQSKYPQVEVLVIGEPVGCPLHDFYLVIEALQRTCRYLTFVPVQDALTMPFKLFAELIHGLHSHTPGILDPGVQAMIGLPNADVSLPDIPDLLLQEVCLR